MSSALVKAMKQKLKLILKKLKRETSKRPSFESRKATATRRKALKASIIQMIKQHKIVDFAGDVAYQFIDENKIKRFTYLSKFIMHLLPAV